MQFHLISTLTLCNIGSKWYWSTNENVKKSHNRKKDDLIDFNISSSGLIVTRYA